MTELIYFFTEIIQPDSLNDKSEVDPDRLSSCHVQAIISEHLREESRECKRQHEEHVTRVIASKTTTSKLTSTTPSMPNDFFILCRKDTTDVMSHKLNNNMKTPTLTELAARFSKHSHFEPCIKNTRKRHKIQNSNNVVKTLSLADNIRSVPTITVDGSSIIDSFAVLQSASASISTSNLMSATSSNLDFQYSSASRKICFENPRLPSNSVVTHTQLPEMPVNACVQARPIVVPSCDGSAYNWTEKLSENRVNFRKLFQSDKWNNRTNFKNVDSINCHRGTSHPPGWTSEQPGIHRVNLNSISLKNQAPVMNQTFNNYCSRVLENQTPASNNIGWSTRDKPNSDSINCKTGSHRKIVLVFPADACQSSYENNDDEQL